MEANGKATCVLHSVMTYIDLLLHPQTCEAMTLWNIPHLQYFFQFTIHLV